MFLVLLLALLLPPQGTSVIAGTVVAGDTNRPVQRARVTLTRTPLSSTVSVTTDAQGAFSFPGLIPGRYQIAAAKAGFLTVHYGEKSPGVSRSGAVIVLEAAQRVDRVTLRLPRGGALAGVVSDDLGDPAFGVQVRALQTRTGPDGRGIAIAGTAVTDDRGAYRIPLLAPGEYVVCALPAIERTASASAANIADLQQYLQQRQPAGSPVQIPSILAAPSEPDPVTSYVPVCFPGTTQFSSAMPIALGLSEEHGGVDVPLQLVPSLKVAGTVVDPGGSAASAEVQIVASGTSAMPAAIGMSTWNTMAGPGGTFSFNGIPPGQYRIFTRARRPTGADPAGVRTAPAAGDVRWAMEDLTVGTANVTDLVLTLQRGLTVSGTLVFDNPSPAPATSAHMVVMFTPAGDARGLAELGGVQSAPVDQNGRFTVGDLVPGLYRVAPTPLPKGWTLASAVFAGRDALDFPLEVLPGGVLAPGVLTLTSRPTIIAGRVFDPAGAPASARTVVVFAEDPRYWTPASRRILVAMSNETAAFSFDGLPPGTYRLAAADLDGRSAFDPALLRELAAISTPAILAAGETKAVDVRIR